VKRRIASAALILALAFGSVTFTPPPPAEAHHQVFKHNERQSCPHCSRWNWFCRLANWLECKPAPRRFG
jgi:hypothetical protein